jgi:hypothetical protein
MVIYVILLFYAFLLAFWGVAIIPMCLAICLPFFALQIGAFLLAGPALHGMSQHHTRIPGGLGDATEEGSRRCAGAW